MDDDRPADRPRVALPPDDDGVVLRPVLSGAVRLYDGRSWTDAGPGDFLHVPVGGVHAFRNDSGAQAEVLLLFTPGAPREAYFAGLAELTASGRTLTDSERAAFLAAHDQYAA